MGVVAIGLLGLTGLLSIPLITAFFARRMGRSFNKWFLIGIVLPIIAVFILFFLPDISNNNSNSI